MKRCIYCKNKGYVTGKELSMQYGTTTFTVAKCQKCKGKSRNN